jgi:hypothetical protein
MPRGGKRTNQTGRPRTANPAVRVLTLFGPAALRQAFQAADAATQANARTAALEALRTALNASKEPTP